MKKVGIISPCRRIVLNKKNIRSLESIYIYNYLKHIKKYDVYYISKKLKTENDLNYYLDIENTNLNDFDEIYYHNAQINMFGGEMIEGAFVLIKKLLDYKKPIYSIITDPKILLYNVIEYLFERKEYFKEKNIELYNLILENFKEEDINKFKNLNFSSAFCGQDYNLFKKIIKEKSNKHTIIPEKAINFPLFEFMAINFDQKIKPNLYIHDKIYDICYFGNKRIGDRHKKLKKYFNNNLKKIIYGFKDSFKNCTYKPYINNELLYDELQKSFSSIIIGDKEHDNNFITARFFETIRAGIVGFIDIQYDGQKKLISNEFLRNFLYVDSSYDLKIKIERLKNDQELYSKIINYQYKELEKWRDLKI